MNKGYFVISDISGYTDFLTKSELDHANDILTGLMEVITNNVHLPLKISNFQGDAVLMYADADKIILGQTLVHQIETIYFEFTKYLKNMAFNTTCDCKACHNIPNLDLKFFIHYGKYAIQKIHGREELSGTDVILIHRLMKNDVVEKTGVKAYALFTEIAIQNLNITDYSDTFISHEEVVEKIGTINIKVYSLHDLWKKELQREENKVVIDTEDEWIRVEQELPVPPNQAWDYITNASLKKDWMNLKSISLENKKNKYDVGSSYHCVHDSGEFSYEIVDWRPFNYITFYGEVGGFLFAQMEVLKPTENGSILTVIVVPRSNGLIQRFFNNRLAKKLKAPLFDVYRNSRADLAKYIEEHQQVLSN
jgi:Protein of unknown function (DUF2652)